MSRRQEFERAIRNAERIWKSQNSPFVKVRKSPIVRFRNQANINEFIGAFDLGVRYPNPPTQPNGRRLRPNTNYVIMRSSQPFYPEEIKINFPLNKGYYSPYSNNKYGLANKNNVYRIAQNLSLRQLRSEMTSTPAKRHIAAAKVSQILGNAIERRRQLKNFMIYLAGLRKMKKRNARMTAARRRVSTISRHT